MFDMIYEPLCNFKLAFIQYHCYQVQDDTVIHSLVNYDGLRAWVLGSVTQYVPLLRSLFRPSVCPSVTRVSCGKLRTFYRKNLFYTT